MSPDADLRLVTLAAQRIIERAWGSRAIRTRAKTSQPPRAFARRITPRAERTPLQLFLERGEERAAARGAAGGAATTDAAGRSVAVELVPPEDEDERDRGRNIGVDRSRYAELFRLPCALDAHKT